MKKLTSIAVSSMLALSLFAGIASAHVTVQPGETTQGKYEVFTVRVPSEKEDSPTVKVEVKFPEDVNVSRFEPKPGWTYELQEDETGKIIGVTWTTEGQGITPTEFVQFNFQGRVGDEATELSWKAYQTYQDGEVVEWVGSEGSDKPASVTKVQPSQGGTDGHGAPAAVENPAEGAEDTSSSLPLYLSIAALLLGALSLGISLKKKS